MTTNGWDVKPIYKAYRGQTMEFFTRRALAIALNRQMGTIRSLEQKGVLCHPRVRLETRGWWLYTRDQIEDLVKLAEEEKVLDPRYRAVFSPRFIREAKAIIRRIPT